MTSARSGPVTEDRFERGSKTATSGDMGSTEEDVGRARAVSSDSMGAGGAGGALEQPSAKTHAPTDSDPSPPETKLSIAASRLGPAIRDRSPG